MARPCVSTRETASAIGAAVPVEVCRRELARGFIRRHSRDWRYDRHWRRWLCIKLHGYWWPADERLQIKIQNLRTDAVREAEHMGARRLVLAFGTHTTTRAIERLFREELSWPREAGQDEYSA